MAIIYRFEELIVWQESRELAKIIHKMMVNVSDRDFKSQIQRAAVSIMNNIAEGFDRNKIDESNKSFIYFLDISYGSCGEVRSMAYLAEDLGYLSTEQSALIKNNCKSISNKLFAFIQNLKNNAKPKPTSPQQPTY